MGFADFFCGIFPLKIQKGKTNWPTNYLVLFQHWNISPSLMNMYIVTRFSSCEHTILSHMHTLKSTHTNNRQTHGHILSGCMFHEVCVCSSSETVGSSAHRAFDDRRARISRSCTMLKGETIICEDMWTVDSRSQRWIFIFWKIYFGFLDESRIEVFWILLHDNRRWLIKRA